MKKSMEGTEVGVREARYIQEQLQGELSSLILARVPDRILTLARARVEAHRRFVFGNSFCPGKELELFGQAILAIEVAKYRNGLRVRSAV